MYNTDISFSIEKKKKEDKPPEILSCIETSYFSLTLLPRFIFIGLIIPQSPGVLKRMFDQIFRWELAGTCHLGVLLTIDFLRKEISPLFIPLHRNIIISTEDYIFSVITDPRKSRTTL